MYVFHAKTRLLLWTLYSIVTVRKANVYISTSSWPALSRDWPRRYTWFYKVTIVS